MLLRDRSSGRDSAEGMSFCTGKGILPFAMLFCGKMELTEKGLYFIIYKCATAPHQSYWEGGI